MTSRTNRYGLSRDVPEDISRRLRQDCGFGCVICGASVYTYEHIDPEFANAQLHDPAAMALLCDGCHGQVTRKFWSKDKVKAARGAPHCRQTGFSWGDFDFGQKQPVIRFAGSTIRNCSIPLEVSNIPAFIVRAPESDGAPFRLSANFFGSNGEPILRIVDNAWEAMSDNAWDMEFTGGRIVIRDHTQSQCLVLRALPPHGIAVERLRMRVGKREVIGNETEFSVGGVTFSGCIADGCRVGFSL